MDMSSAQTGQLKKKKNYKFLVHVVHVASLHFSGSSKGPFTRASTFASACGLASRYNIVSMRTLRQTQRMGVEPILLCV